jgi:BirA family biotin operon repressor/biotin-[acetyl-CoA-carboxylase] ligase
MKYKDINFIHFDTIASTNTWAKENAIHFDPHQFTCITALHQTAGRGRFSRKWVSPRGQNIYATLFFTLPIGCSYLVNTGQILALSCTTILREKGFLAELKWPNDILVGGKKIAGILTETTPLDGYTGVILGIGINVNMSEELLNSIDQPATSLSQLSMKTWKLEQILEPLLKEFIKNLDSLKQKGFGAFQKDFQDKLAFRGEMISCHDGVRVIKGICHSITADGRLEIELPSGERVRVMAGELQL